ncbi:hypothetical protein CANARDRAFT_29334 [[Candida] arabinofermentans NRRL YB-2248]|uniref:AAA+ ATPase domain-containing protein n=1 Tax=[Candida] arabinofermentans NRRL YB-2248 TaxID=983967 RepID=A0A1E4SXG0_9ASCO|nr:hypothetical protein CANARDRAFT_29334 [[Candida] arabinofermentans NRRL YB-2248]
MAKAKGGSRKVGALQQEMDNKVYNLIMSLLEEETEIMRQKGITNGPITMALARDLTGRQIFEYVKTKDKYFGRVKDDHIRYSIDRTWKVVIADEEEEMRGMGLDPEKLNFNEDDEEGASDFNEEDLMDVKDINQANKSVVNVWNLPSSKNSQNKNDDEVIKPVEPIEEKIEAPEEQQQQQKEEEVKPKKRSKDSHKSAKRAKISKDRTPPTITLSSLGGLDEVTRELMEVVGLPILHPELYLSTGIQPPRGVLLHGPPGCGKTTIANALAGELQVPFISLSAPSVVSGMSGESEKKLREIFEEAKQLAPCLIFFDEIDAITPKRDGGAQREMERRIVAQLLTSMDELSLDKTGGKPVIVIGATNRPDSLDAALRRAGRFDREICINVPNEISRFNILESMTKQLKISGELGLMELAKMTPGFVGADLKALVTSAGIQAIKRIFSSMNKEQEQLLLLEGEQQQQEQQQQQQQQQQQLQEITNQEEGEITNGVDGMEIDSEIKEIQQHIFHESISNIDFMKLSTIQKFLLKHPSPLTTEQLEPLCITHDDFIDALPTIQPTAKREGFATVPDVTWANVGALMHIRVELHMAIVQPIKRPEIYERVGITAPAGVLMWGPPGCGKTLLAKAVANESKANFISVKGPELLNKYVGESERAVRQVFARARASVPCIIFFDELDALVPRRDTTLSESSSRVVNTLLTELDGLNDRKGIFVVGATNRPDMIDPAMLRPGRLDKTLYIELPTAPERLEILKTLINSNGTPVESSVDLNSIAHDERCRNFSGADLSSLVREAAVISLKRKLFTGINFGDENIKELSNGEDDEKIFVTSEDFDNALNSVKPSVSDRDRAKYERLNKRLGWSKTETNEAIDNTEVS